MEKQLPKRLSVKIENKELKRFSDDCYKSIAAAFKEQGLSVRHYFEDNTTPITPEGDVYFQTKYTLAFFISKIDEGEIKYQVKTNSSETFRTDDIENIGQFVLDKLTSIIKPKVDYSLLNRYDNKKSRLLNLSDNEAREILDRAVRLLYSERVIAKLNGGRFTLPNSIRICLRLEPLDNSKPVHNYKLATGAEGDRRTRCNVTIYQVEWEDLLERAKRLRCPYDTDGTILRFLLNLPHYGQGAPELHGEYVGWRERYSKDRGRGKVISNADN